MAAGQGTMFNDHAAAPSGGLELDLLPAARVLEPSLALLCIRLRRCMRVLLRLKPRACISRREMCGLRLGARLVRVGARVRMRVSSPFPYSPFPLLIT